MTTGQLIVGSIGMVGRFVAILFAKLILNLENIISESILNLANIYDIISAC